MKARLTKIADIRNGYQFRGKVSPAELSPEESRVSVLPAGVVPLIQIKDIDTDRRLQTDDFVLVKIDVNAEKYETRKGDVLFLARGHRLFATAITVPVGGAVATGYFFILRPKVEAIMPRYLAWYINQRPFQSVLRTFMKGTQQPLVSRSDIENLEVEIPPLAVQEAIVALDDLRVRERQLMQRLQEKRTQLLQTISLKAVRRPS